MDLQVVCKRQGNNFAYDFEKMVDNEKNLNAEFAGESRELILYLALLVDNQAR